MPFTTTGSGGGWGPPAVAAPPPPELPAWLTEQALWHWFEVSGTALSSVAPSPTPGGSAGPAGKISAWCGATLKRSGSVYMLGAAGGHADYFGNEVNALTLNTGSPAWVQLRAPSAAEYVVDDPAQFYLDSRPSPTHTYNATQFIDSLNRMFVFPSPGINAGVTEAPDWYPGDKRSFVFNVASGDWESPDYVPQYPGTGDFTACLCVKHQTTGCVYYSRSYSDGFYRWNAGSNTWTFVSGYSLNPWYVGVAMDPTRNRMLCVGSYPGTSAPLVVSTAGAEVSATFGGLGAGALTFGGHPGVVYDEHNDTFIALQNSSPIELYRVTAGAWSVDQPTVTGTKPAQRENGIHNSVQYVPELRCIVIANAYSGNVKCMRTG